MTADPLLEAFCCDCLGASSSMFHDKSCPLLEATGNVQEYRLLFERLFSKTVADNEPHTDPYVADKMPKDCLIFPCHTSLALR
jgi:hypothetical protein